MGRNLEDNTELHYAYRDFVSLVCTHDSGFKMFTIVYPIMSRIYVTTMPWYRVLANPGLVKELTSMYKHRYAILYNPSVLYITSRVWETHALIMDVLTQKAGEIVWAWSDWYRSKRNGAHENVIMFNTPIITAIAGESQQNRSINVRDKLKFSNAQPAYLSNGARLREKQKASIITCCERRKRFD